MTRSPEDRRGELLKRFPTWEPMPLHQRFDVLSEEFGDRPVVITDDVQLTYAQVRDLSLDLARGLLDSGVSHGDRVSLLLANHPEYLALKVAVSRVGAVAVPLNFLYREAELAYVLGQSRTNVLVTMSGYQGLDHLAMLDTIAPGWADGAQSAFPDLREVVVHGESGRRGVRSLDRLAADGRASTSTTAFPDVSPDDVSDMFYTSGTTGSPKGVLNTHDGMLRSSFASATTRALDTGWRTLFSLPLYHTFGYTEGVLAPLWVGGAFLPRLKFSAEDYLSGIERLGATEILTVPTMMVAILDAAQQQAQERPYDLSSLVAVMSASALAPVWLWERMKELLGNCDVVTAWGMTETSASCTMTVPEDPLHVHSSTVGRPKLAGPAAWHEGRIAHIVTVDPETGERLSAGTVGEFAISSPITAIGYWEKPEETAAVLRDGWLRTGDIGYLDDQGRMVLTGRAKELYKSGGELIMPKEIEELLTTVPGVVQAYAIGLPDPYWGEAGCAVVVVEPGSALTAQDVLDACRRGLAKFKVPKHVVFMAAQDLPTTPMGKVQRHLLAAMVKDTVTPS